jgi:hypothetical protein
MKLKGSLILLVAALMAALYSAVLAQSSTFCDSVDLDGVALYELVGCESTGLAVEFAQTGSINLLDSEFADLAKSTFVASGWSMKVYSDANEQGRSHCLIPGVLWDLSLDNWPGTQVPMANDVASVQVFNNEDCQPEEIQTVWELFLPSVITPQVFFCDSVDLDGVALYELVGCESTGLAVEFAQTGSINLLDSEFADLAKSTFVASGWSMKVYSDANEQGRSHCLIPGVLWDLSLDNWPGTQVPMANDVASVQVFNNEDCQH